LTSLVRLLTTLFIAVITSWLTVWFSLRRFRAERWWERKVQAYERIIGALHDSKEWYEQHLKAEKQQTDLSDVVVASLRTRSRSAHAEIAKAIDTGAFLLAVEAVKRLRQYQDEQKAAQHNSWIDHLLADLSAIDDCLKDLIRIARRDVKR
jgi:hypothetical protein